MTAMINSVALANVAFSRPPMPEPTREAISSVAVPRTFARGTIASALTMKSQRSGRPSSLTTGASGTKISKP
ncbi:MAG: hypothetical protein ACR2M0_06615 [Chloroflexia bacterium]